MGVCRFRPAELALLLLLLPALAVAEPLVDQPVVWDAGDTRPLAKRPASRQPPVQWSFYEDGVVRPVEYALNLPRLVRRLGAPFGVEKDRESANVNRLGEVPNSSWFTNRIGLFPLPPSALELGPNRSRGPSRRAPWQIVAAKDEGVTPGFTIEDAEGQRYVIKFAPREAPIAPTAAGVVAQRLLWAAGYWVPEDEIVHFDPAQLRLAGGVTIHDEDGDREMTEADIAAILERVGRDGQGRVRALASRYLEGEPIGPFDFTGLRGDDPNDTVPHELRRELRGLNVFAEWLVHFDTKQQNTLDMVVEGLQGPYVRHYLIDFASTLGTGAHGPTENWGWEVSVDPAAIFRRTLGLGVAVPDYRQVSRNEELPAAGWYESEVFEADGFRPMMQNPAFQRMTDRDGYWAAKILSAFTDEHLRVAVAQGQYTDVATREYMVATLAARRDRICRHWFDRIAPLDFFVVRGKEIVWQDLGASRRIYDGSPRYRARLRRVDADRDGEHGAWVELERTAIRFDRVSGPGQFVELEVQVDRGGGYSPSVFCYLATGSGRVVEVWRERR